MKILYFLEPSKELGKKLFRLGSIRNHINNEIEALFSSNLPIELNILCSQEVAEAAKSENLLINANVFTIAQKEFDRFFDKYGSVGLWYSKRYTEKDLRTAKALCRKALGKLEPDVIICYEGCAPYLQEMYPEAVFINSTLGMLSRAPFPETGCLDIFGVFKDSYLSKFKDELNGLKLSVSEKNNLQRFRQSYIDFCSLYNPVTESDVRCGFQSVLLLSLQVSGYFAFDENTPQEQNINNQIDLIKYVLGRVSSDIGVFVTLHGAECTPEIENEIDKLKLEFNNLIYNKDIQRIKWCSQYVLPFVDGVVTVSSSVGLQAALLNKKVYVVGKSHLNLFDCGPLEDAHLHLNKKCDFDNVIHYLLSCYYYDMSTKIQNGIWLFNFFKTMLSAHRNNRLDFYVYKEFYDENAIDTLIGNMRVSQALSDIESCSPHLPSSRVIDLSKAKKEILKYNVISFDVFDTLITRNLMHPNHIFDLMQPAADEIFKSEGIQLLSFGTYRNLRERAANRLIRKAKNSGIEEIAFKDIYEEIRALTNISKSATLKLRKLELETEKAVIVVRNSGKELYDFAYKNNKTIILVSDMYLGADDINFLLRKNGFINHSDLFVSSELNKLKKSGSLYLPVKEKYGNDILHFGDNHLSDVLRATEAGISAIHTPMISETYCASKIINENDDSKKIFDSLGGSLTHGVISRKFYDNVIENDSWFNGSAYQLGYQACGSILLGFTKWIIEQAIRDGVEHLYFLARDGYLVKNIYDKIASSYPNAPASHYLLASRRCYNTASLKNEQDILSSVSLSFSKVPLYKILESRYGISRSEITSEHIKKSGFNTCDDIVDIKRKSQLNKFKRILSLMKDLILEKSNAERNALLIYLDNMGLNSNNNIAVVDIGHNASLQESLGYLLNNRNDIGGYYFMTYHGAHKVYDKGFNIRGYLGEFEDNLVSSHPYCKNIGMFEFLFLPAIPSFKRFVLKNSVLHEEYVGGDESARFDKINHVHRGVMDFVNDIISTTNGNVQLFNLSKNMSIKTYVSFIERPYKKDASIFNDLSFVDQFGGNDARFLIATKKYSPVTNDNYHSYIKDSWWREGAEAMVCDTRDNEDRKSFTIIQTPTRRKSIFLRKLSKLKNNPKAFILDSKLIMTLSTLNKVIR